MIIPCIRNLFLNLCFVCKQLECWMLNLKIVDYKPENFIPQMFVRRGFGRSNDASCSLKWQSSQWALSVVASSFPFFDQFKPQFHYFAICSVINIMGVLTKKKQSPVCIFKVVMVIKIVKIVWKLSICFLTLRNIKILYMQSIQ